MSGDVLDFSDRDGVIFTNHKGSQPVSRAHSHVDVLARISLQAHTARDWRGVVSRDGFTAAGEIHGGQR